MFFLSIILNLFSSYIIASFGRSFLIIFISYFALIVLNIEILSLFGAIGKNSLFLFSILNFILAFSFWKYKKFPLLKFNLDFKRIKNSFLLDKSLIILFFAFIFFFFTVLILSLVMPALEPDSQTYHFIRAVEFFEHKKLIHFQTGDIRGLIMPFNSEIIYTWMYAFKDNFRGYGIVSLISFVFSIFAVVDIFVKFKISYRKIIWTVFILSSFPAVIVQTCSLQTDIIIASLLLSSIALFLNKNNSSVYFSSLAYCLAFGTKSTAGISIFSIFLIFFAIEFLYFKDKSFSKIKKFILYSIINFIIFSSYNYILNYIDFHSPFSNHAAYIWHRFWGGYKGFIANLIHFFFQSFDFTGFKWGFYLNNHILDFKNLVFKFIHITPDTGCNVAWRKVNILADEQIVGFGILGFLVFLPSVAISFGKIFFKKTKKAIFLFIFSLAFIVNIISLSLTLGYMIYSIRFIVSFVFLSSFCLAYSYRKKSFLKPVIILFAMFYMIFISTNIARMPAKYVIRGLKDSKFNLEKFEENCFRGRITNTLQLSTEIYDTILNDFKDYKNIAVFKTTSSSLLFLKSLQKKGYKIDFLKTSNVEKYDLNKYDLIIFEGEMQDDSVFNPEDIKINYKIDGTNIRFNEVDGIQCFYIAINDHTYDSMSRTCLGYDYMKRNKKFKEVETKTFYPDKKSGMREVKIHYFNKI